MKDLRLDLQIRNNRLRERREQLGLTQAEVAAQVGCTQSGYGSFECLTASPISKKTGSWTKTARKIAAFFCVEPEELWPDDVLMIKETRTSASVDVRDLAMMLAGNEPVTPEATLGDEEMNRRLRLAVAELPRHVRHVIERRFGLNGDPMTLGAIGDGLHLSRTRVQQLERTGLAMLRNPKRKLAESCGRVIDATAKERRRGK